jgi:hypothetical protein
LRQRLFLIADDSMGGRPARLDSINNGADDDGSEKAFKNIKLFAGMPAARIPRMMNIGFGKSLGVSCEHCHDTRRCVIVRRPDQCRRPCSSRARLTTRRDI